GIKRRQKARDGGDQQKKPSMSWAFSFVWRRGRDSNPRYAINVYTLSRRAPSTTRTPLRIPVTGRCQFRGALMYPNQSGLANSICRLGSHLFAGTLPDRAGMRL